MPPKKRKSKASISQARKKCKVVKDDGGTNDGVPFHHERTQNSKPCYDALGITEILESILQCLPPTQLHLIQRVNKCFQNVIIKSPRIQRSLLLRIDNKPGAPWTFHQPYGNWNVRDWCLDQASGGNSDSGDLVTQIEINPSLHVSKGYMDLIPMFFRSDIKEILQRGPILQFAHGRASTLEQIGQQGSISISFLSDPHCPNIGVLLWFALGVRCPTLIMVHSVIESDSPMTIGAIISRCLDTRGTIHIKWRGDGCTATENYEPREGLPRQLLNDLKNQSGLDVYFRPKDTVIIPNRTVVLTCKAKATVELRQKKISEILSSLTAVR